MGFIGDSKGMELRGKLFGEFEHYLKQAGIDPDLFDRRTWMSKCWDFFYDKYRSDERLIASRYISSLPAAALRDMATKKEAIEKEAGDNSEAGK